MRKINNCNDKKFYQLADLVLNKSEEELLFKIKFNYSFLPKNIKTTLENYFDKYHQYWLEIRNNYKSHKFKKWYDIWFILKDKNRAKICVNQFPKHEQQKYIEAIEKI